MIDTHCHIDDPCYADGLDAFLYTQQADGVECMVVPGVDDTSIQTVLTLCDDYPSYLYPALGLHPENVREDWQVQLSHIGAAIKGRLETKKPLVAIGEIGLDYHFDTTFQVEQKEALRVQLQWAENWHLPVIIHSRDATEDCLQVLHTYPAVKGVMHCFNGSREVAEQVIKMGYLLGIGGVLTFKNCKLSETLRDIPLCYLVLETDAPYMAPVPHRGQRNESRWMALVADRLAEIYHCDVEYVYRVTNENAKRLFGIK